MITLCAAKHRLVSILMLGTLLFGVPRCGEPSPSPRSQKGRAIDTPRKFDVLAAQWATHCRDVQFSSNLGDYIDDPAYRKLVALGPAAIPTIMHRYRAGNECPWELALEEITGIAMIENPESYDRAQVRERWLYWWGHNHQDDMPPSWLLHLRDPAHPGDAGATPPLRQNQIGRMLPSPASRPGRPAYRVQLRHDLVHQPFGNQHITDIRAQLDTLDVLFANDFPKWQLNFACVPWEAIRQQKVRYGLPEMYGPGDIKSYRRSPLAPDPRRQAGPVPAISGLDPANVLGIIQVQDDEAYLFAKDRIIKLQPDTGGIVWQSELPHGHTAIAFDVSYGLLWVVTNSNQGYHDGELGHPFLTTSVYAIAPPPQHH